ncbi:related to vivid PAS protein VVD [Phialocephala subalpina]|uniref:Related to vivid PAS protein VVD n=1 Tax=Phialocephala subalpina TaxID=576137 RepID=A0A1L7WHH1_9HELO|nr:related to vivid PAS protein VVD [Phialocephala subalpina]
MNSEYQLQAQRLEELRRAVAAQNAQNSSSGSTIVDVGPPRKLARKKYIVESREDPNHPLKDPLIYPGVYAPSGIDMMSILVRVYNRPNQQIHIGNVDSAVALVLADAEQPDLPVIYCSEPFETLTGYSSAEIMGRNCRFLQYPPGGEAYQNQQVNESNAESRKDLREKIGSGEEARVRLLNYRKDGSIFANLLTIIPIVWDEGQVKKKYIVGFQADEGRTFL